MLCDKAILLNHGVVIEEGSSESVVNSYNFLSAKLNDIENKVTLINKNGKHLFGTFEAKIRNVTILGENSLSNVISSGEYAVITAEVEPTRDIEAVTVGIMIRDKYGQDIFGTNTYHHNVKIDLKKDVIIKCMFKMRMDIGPGKYSVTAALHAEDTHVKNCFYWEDYIATFEVAGNYHNMYLGLCKLYPAIDVKTSG
jgi:lipopolysaccharide transport system ATP-binding protein